MSYRRLATPLHAARASVVAGYCAALILAVLLTASPLVLAALLVAVLGAARCAGVGRPVARTLLLSAPMALTIVAINALSNRNGLTVLVRLGELGPLGQVDVTLEALAYGARLGAQLALVVAVCALASATIDPDATLRGMRRWSFHSALTATLATRIVPLLARDAQRIGEAQRARRHGATPRLAVARALTVNALDRALDVAATLEVRGYALATRPPRAAHARASRHDIAFALAAALIVSCSLTASVLSLAPMRYYPQLGGALGGRGWLVGILLVLATLAPFADRRGVER